MNLHKENTWWHIFSPENSSRTVERCPVVPIHSGQDWQKGLAVSTVHAKPTLMQLNARSHFN